MLEYPKALYLSIDDYRIVTDKSAETKARKLGFKDFADLVEPTVVATNIPSLYGADDVTDNPDHNNLGSPS